MIPSYRLLVLGLVSAFTLAGCAVYGEPAMMEAPVLPYTQLSAIAPPPLQAEATQTPEDPTMAIWRAGHWEKSGGGFAWVPGELMQKPVPFASWSNDRWERRTYGWAFIPGYWQ